MNARTDLNWIPASGIQLHRAGVRFDAIRVDGERGRDLADRLAHLTGGTPGPIIEAASGRRAVYFLVGAGSTTHRAWQPDVTRLTSGPDHVSFIPVPALDGLTWPLSWRYRPTHPGDRVHTLLLRTVLHSPE
ncbi:MULTISPECIES: hypothetical protein [unclassified Streptomyces]|uniref:hypothetical protein n=1 Tax=unclassified Streptomyces TaxID=2593676 RepID=UPI003D71D220